MKRIHRLATFHATTFPFDSRARVRNQRFQLRCAHQFSSLVRIDLSGHVLVPDSSIRIHTYTPRFLRFDNTSNLFLRSDNLLMATALSRRTGGLRILLGTRFPAQTAEVRLASLEHTSLHPLSWAVVLSSSPGVRAEWIKTRMAAAFTVIAASCRRQRTPCSGVSLLGSGPWFASNSQANVATHESEAVTLHGVPSRKNCA